MVTKLVVQWIALYPSSVLAKILMVTKRMDHEPTGQEGSVLAKILMVTKQDALHGFVEMSSVLAKILTVTKHIQIAYGTCTCSVLAKILMVTKLLSYVLSISPEFCSSKNPYGNKTRGFMFQTA